MLAQLKVVRIAYRLMLAWSLLVALQFLIASARGLGNTDGGFTMFYYLFLGFEPVAWFAFLVAVLATAKSLDRAEPTNAHSVFERLSGDRARVVVALGTFGVLWLCTHFVYHSYPFSMDEYASEFQARIFMSGRMKATLPAEWRRFGHALTPVFISYDTREHTWISSYLPVYAALRALLMSLRLGSALNPLLGALSVLLIADTAKRVNPQQPLAPVAAVVLLLTSAQFFATSISFYSMPAHLCANLLWLSLYLRNTRWSLAVLPWLGGLAVGLHQPVVHALFVLPFLLEIVWRRRIALAAYCATVYLAFLGLWYWWHQQAILADSLAHAAELFHSPGFDEALTQSVNLTLVLSWQSGAFVVCLIIGLFGLVARGSAPVHRNLAFGLALTLIFYFFYHTDQGHGWGYRYVYGVLGNAMLLAAFGFCRLAESLGQPRALRLLGVSTLIALCVQLPFRAFEVDCVLAPFVRGRGYLSAMDADMVIVEHRKIWYGQDLVRNDPLFHTRPLLLRSDALRPGEESKVRAHGRTQIAYAKDFVALGMNANSAFVESLERTAAANPGTTR